jgi:hypothetical protein
MLLHGKLSDCIEAIGLISTFSTEEYYPKPSYGGMIYTPFDSITPWEVAAICRERHASHAHKHLQHRTSSHYHTSTGCGSDNAQTVFGREVIMGKGSRGQKTEAIRRVLARNVGQGMTAGEIRQAVGNLVDPKYLYKALGKMKNNGQITRSRGRYSLTHRRPGLKAAVSLRERRSETGNKSLRAGASASRLDQHLSRMKQEFQEYCRGYRDGWDQAKRSLV